MVRDSMEIADDVAEDERCRVPVRNLHGNPYH